MVIILNLETATEVCSVCISKNGKVAAIAEKNDGFSHAKTITLLIDQCCQQAGIKLNDIDAVSLSSGPGSYTSLRVGSSAAKGICYALQKPLIAIDTLQALAYAAAAKNSNKQGVYIPMIDARRMEVYTAIFNEKNESIVETHAHIITPASFEDHLSADQYCYLFGSGAPKCQEVLKNPQFIFLPLLCSASNNVELAHLSYEKKQFSDVAYFAPKYHKAPNISVSKKNIL